MRLARSIAAASLAGLLLGAGCGAPRETPPSVLLIVVDTLRADHLGTYGYARPTSPHLDALAQRGALFEHAQSTSSWTLPSMASLLTGLLPSRHGCGVDRSEGGAGEPRDFLALPEGLATLAQAHAAAGFDTAAFVTNNFLKPAFGLDRGFAHYEQRYPAEAEDVVARVVDWLHGRREGPYFVLVHLMDPHLPYDAGGGFAGTFTGGMKSSLSLPVREIRRLRQTAAHMPKADREFVTAAYDEEIAYVDDQIGRLLEAFGAAGSDGGPLVLVTSDHGEELFDHGGFEHGHSLYQELLHVPLILAGPGIEPRRIETPVSLVDVAATLCALTGTEPGGLEGRSFEPLLRGAPLTPAEAISEGILYGPEQSALLAWPLKVIVGPSATTTFDLASDAHERHPLERAPDEARLRAALERRQVDDRARARPAVRAELDPTATSQLKSLGYAGDEE